MFSLKLVVKMAVAVSATYIARMQVVTTEIMESHQSADCSVNVWKCSLRYSCHGCTANTNTEKEHACCGHTDDLNLLRNLWINQ